MGMFDDMFASSRGPGVIGMGLAMVVLLGFGTLYIFVFDESLGGGAKTIEGQIKENDIQIESLIAQEKNHNDAIAHNVKLVGVAEQYDGAARTLRLRQDTNKTLAAKKIEEEAAIKQLGEEWEIYKTKYRASARAAIIGQLIPTITTKKGKTYDKVVIKKIDDLRLEISHSSGTKTIPFEEMPDDIYDTLQFTKELATKQKTGEESFAGSVAHASNITEMRENIAFHRQQIQEKTALLASKRADADQSNTRIQNYRADINNLEGRISAESQGSGLRRTNQHRAGITQLQAMIKVEQTKLQNFPIENKAILDENNRRLAEIRKLELAIQAHSLKQGAKPN